MKLKRPSAYLFVESLVIISIERGIPATMKGRVALTDGLVVSGRRYTPQLLSPAKQDIQDNAQGPDIARWQIDTVANDFRAEVARRADERSMHLGFVLQTS
jgi:hypothetical protein